MQYRKSLWRLVARLKARLVTLRLKSNDSRQLESGTLRNAQQAGMPRYKAETPRGAGYLIDVIGAQRLAFV